MESKINPKMIVLARESRGMTQGDLAKANKSTQGWISVLEQEEFTASDEILSSLSKILKYPQDFFLQKGQSSPVVTGYRKRERVPQKVLNTLEARMNIYRLNIETLLKGVTLPNLDFPTIDISKSGTPQEAAIKLRKQWKLEKGAIENLTEVVEGKGIIVLLFNFETGRVDSRTILTEANQPIIFLNTTLPGDRQRFSLALELGKLVMHSLTAPGFDRDIDHEANLFAAEFLMPEKDIKQDLIKDKLTLERLAELKKKWKVSMISLVYRANDLEIISDNQKRYLVEQFNALKIRRREPSEVEIALEKASLLQKTLNKFRTAGKFTVKELAAKLHLNEDEFLTMYSFNK